MSFAWFFIGAILATWWSRSHRRGGWRSVCGRFGDSGRNEPSLEEQLRKQQRKRQIKEAAMDATLEALQTFRIKLAAIRLANPEAQASISTPVARPDLANPLAASVNMGVSTPASVGEKVGHDAVYV